MTDVLILNLNEIAVVKDSIARLKREQAKGVVDKIIVVDNGSDQEDKSILYETDGIVLVDLPENKGASVGRNAGLEETDTKRIFLLDGDILYVPGSVKGLNKVMDELPDAACVGVHNPQQMNGTRNRLEADPMFPPNPGKPYSDFDMAWTQYGLFDGDFLRKTRFYDKAIFGEAGNGYEDDWLWQDARSVGLKSYYVPNVLYYHEAHGGQRWLDAHERDNRNKERLRLFKEHWNDMPWHEKKAKLHSSWLKDHL